MTNEEVIRNCENLLEGGIENPLYQMMLTMMNMLMEMEANKITGCEKGEHNSERTDYRSGTRERRFDTRLGTFNLRIPKFRNGGYVPFFLRNRQRSEEALTGMVVEAYTNGTSARKIKRLAERPGIENISAGEVSEMNKTLDCMVREFQERELEKEYPVLWIDAVYEKIRVGRHVRNMAVMVAKAVNIAGKPEIIGIEVMENESGTAHTEFFNKLKERCVEKVWLCVSDAHTGLQAAIRKCRTGSVWQRCKVHFMRNITAYVPKKQKEAFGAELKKIWQGDTREEAVKRKEAFIENYAEKYPKAVECLDDGFEDSIQYYGFSKIDQRKISSTNTLERLNKEIRRRSRAVGIFPSVKSYLRLMTTCLIEYSEDHLTGASYISADTLREQKTELEKGFNAA